MRQEIYWHTTVDMPGEGISSLLPERVDAAVVGGGYTGLSAARAFAQAGASVAVLEAETIGWGASSRNGGMVLTGLKLPMKTVVRRYGSETAKQLFQFSLQAIDCVETIVHEEKIDCGFARTGHLLTANKPAHFEAMRAEADFLASEFGHHVQIIPPGQLLEELGTGIYPGALLDPLSAGLNPARFAAGLAGAAARAGVLLCSDARVDRIESLSRQGKGGGFLLHTARGRIKADQVLVATSGYTKAVTPALHRKVIPIGSFIIATEQLPEELASALIPRGRMVFDSRHFLNYFRLWDRRMIFGGRAAFFPENASTTRESAAILRSEMVKVFPQLREAAVDFAWGGTLDFTFDQMPHVGEADGLVYALGYAGHGVAMGTFMGKTTAEAMLAGTLYRHPFASFGFPNLPLGLHGSSPFFLPLAGLWYRLLDLVE